MENHNNQSSFEAKLYEVLVQNYLIKYKRIFQTNSVAPTEMKEQYDCNNGYIPPQLQGMGKFSMFVLIKMQHIIPRDRPRPTNFIFLKLHKF